MSSTIKEQSKLSIAMAYKLNYRKTVVELFGQLSTKEVLAVFKDKPVSRATIYRAIKDCQEGIAPQNKPKSGRPFKVDTKTTKKMLSSARDRVGQSTRRLGRPYGVSHVAIHRILKKNVMFQNTPPTN